MKMQFLGVQYREKTWFGQDVAFLHRGSLFRGVAAQAGTGGKGGCSGEVAWNSGECASVRLPKFRMRER